MGALLPAVINLLLLLFVIGALLLVLSSALFHLRQMVAFVPTPQTVTDAMIDLADLTSGETLVDLGAGDGRVLARAMERVPGVRAIGYEGAFGVWLLSRFRAWFSRYRPVMLRRNFLTEDLSQADVVFTYLSISMMQKLAPKFRSELKKGARVVSHAFSIKGLEPEKVTTVTMPFFGVTKVYLYRY